jgi:hypothetical protein
MLAHTAAVSRSRASADRQHRLHGTAVYRQLRTWQWRSDVASKGFVAENRRKNGDV